MPDEMPIETRLGVLEAKFEIAMGVLAMALAGNKAEKQEGMRVLSALDDIKQPSILPNLEDAINANPASSS